MNPIRIIPAEDRAARRLQQRYGLDYTLGLKLNLFDQIAAARSNDNRSTTAVRIAASGLRERWLVGTGGRILNVVVNPHIRAVVTFLGRNAAARDHRA